jgi:hypothetical protein
MTPSGHSPVGSGPFTVHHVLTELAREVQSWPGVQAVTHRFGGTEFRLARGEIGHVHVGGLVDVPFPRRVRDELIREGRACPHHVLPDSGWVSYRVRTREDLPGALALLRLNYERRTAGAKRRAGVVPAASVTPPR